MNLKNKKEAREKLLQSTLLLYMASGLVFVVGVAHLANHIHSFVNTVALYTTQGFERAAVLRQLVPDRLMPGIFEGIGLYLGISALLFGAGTINQKLAASSYEAAEAARAEKNALEAAKVLLSLDGLE